MLSSSSTLPSPPLLDVPLRLLGAEHWRDALKTGLPQLDALSQLPSGMLLAGRMGGIECEVRDMITLRVPLRITDIIGLDLQRSLQVVEGQDGSALLRSAFMPRRAHHTYDGFLTWQDQDGYAIWTPAGPSLVPDQYAEHAQQQDGMWQTWWAVECPEDTQEVCGAESALGTLLAGVDFHRVADRLVFRLHPDTLFPDGVMRLKVLHKESDSASYAVGLDGSGRVTSALAAVRRSGPSVARLQELADAMTGGITMPRDGTVLQVQQHPAGCRYVLDTGDVLVPQDHTYLVVGDVVTAGQRVGGLVDLYTQGQDGQDWWRQLDMSGGVPLDVLCPVPGLVMPSGPVRVTSYDDGGTVRVNVWPDGPQDAVTRYQEWCRNSERRLPVTRHLATALGISAAGETHYPDGLDLLFRLLLGPSAIVARYSPDAPKHVLDTLREHCPLTAVLVFYPVEVD